MIKVFKAGQAAHKPVNLLLYGPPGCGKTTFGATAPNPIFIDYEWKAEKRLRDAFPDSAIIQPGKNDTFQELCDYAIEKGYGSIVIDTVDRLINVVKYQRQQAKKGLFQLQDWGWLIDQISGPLLKLQASNIHVILLCHQTEGKINELDAYGKDKTVLYVRPNIPTNLRDAIPAMVDIVGYMGSPKLVNGMRQIWVKPEENCRWYCKTSWEKMPTDLAPHFGQMLQKYIMPAASEKPASAPVDPGQPAAPKPANNLRELWDKALFDDILADADGKCWIMYLESMYGVASSSELSQDQREDLHQVLMENGNPKRRQAIYNFVRQHQAKP